MPTRVLAYWNNKASRVEVDIDGSNRITAVRWIGDDPATVTLARGDGTRTYTLPRGTRSISVPTTTANRVQLSFDAARNRYSGLAGQILSEG